MSDAVKNSIAKLAGGVVGLPVFAAAFVGWFHFNPIGGEGPTVYQVGMALSRMVESKAGLLVLVTGTALGMICTWVTRTAVLKFLRPMLMKCAACTRSISIKALTCPECNHPVVSR